MLTRYGSPDDLELRDVKKPVPNDGQVLIRIHASAVNDWEWGLVRGKPLYMRAIGGVLRPKIRIIGCDIAGRVEAVGDAVEHLKVGDDVYGDLSDGGFGGFVCAPEGSVGRMPKNITYEEAAALPHAAMLATQSLYEIGRVDRVQTLLINGAGGGVSPIGLQLAKMYGVEVTGVDSTPKLDFLRSLGFDPVVDYTQEDFTSTGASYDLILDVKTNRSPFAYARALEPNGTYVTVGGSTPRLLQCVMLGRWIARTKGRRIHVLSLKPNKGLDVELTRFLGHLILGRVSGGGGPDGSSQQVPGRVPERSRRVGSIVGSVQGGGGEIAWDLGWFARRVGETSS